MGNLFSSEPTFPIKVFCFGNQNGILQEIFPEKIENKDKDNWDHRKLKKSESYTENETQKTISKTIEWKATLYPNIIDDNVDELFEDLIKKMDIPDDDFNEKESDKNDPKVREKTRNIIIKFGKENSNYIINYMNEIPKTHLPQIAIVTNEDFDEKEEGLYDNRYLSIIKGKIKENLMEFLWEKECYYNERGTVLLNTTDKIETNNYINIMLTGVSRSGKSTLINVLSEKLVTLESPFLESVTNKIREYKVITSENGEFLTGLRFFDTPGLTLIKGKGLFSKDRSTVNEVKEAINQKIKENKDSRDDIHLIYFMLKNYNNLEYYVDFFEYIIKINNDRKKEGKKKIYMIFIFNQGNDGSEASLIQFLKDNNLNDLIEKIDESKEEKKISFKEKYKNKNSVKSNQKIKYNIVQLNLLKDVKSGKNVYGIDTLLKLTLHFVRKDNPFSEQYFIDLKKYEAKLKEHSINKNDRKNIEDKIKDIYKKLSGENSFFSNILSIDSIISNAHFYNRIFMTKSIFLNSLFFAYFFQNNKISEYIHVFKKIEHNYKIYTDEIMLKPIMDNVDIKTFKGFEIVDFSNEDDKSKEEINNNIKLLEKSKDLINKNFKSLKINNKFYEYITPFPNISHKKNFYSIMVDYFDNHLKKTCCINYVCRQKQIYDNIFNHLEKMKKKNNWGEFHPVIFK